MTEGKAQQEAGTAAGEPETSTEPVTDARVAETVTSVEATAAPADGDAEDAAESQPATAVSVETAPRRRVTGDGGALPPYAIIETGGKQYRVRVGDQLSVERLPVETGADLTMERVLLLAEDGNVKVGTPVVDGAAVTARVDDHYRGDKIVVFKYKPKKRYRRRQGHRQSLTRLTITAING